MLGNAGAIFSVLTIIIGGVCVLLLVSTKTLRDSRDDQEKRIKFLEDQAVRDKDTISTQAGQIDALGKVVTGEVHLVAIIDLLTEHHTEAVRNWARVSGIIGHIDKSQAEVIAALRESKPKEPKA